MLRKWIVLLALLFTVVSYGLEAAFDKQESFEADISCVNRCRGEKDNYQERFSQTYSAAARGLLPGNGGFFGSLAHDLEAWGREWCLSKAAARCESQSKIFYFSLEKIESGLWLMYPNELNSASTVISPFDSHSFCRTALLKYEDPGFAIETSGNSVAKSGGCIAPLRGELRYGDCMVNANEVELSYRNFLIFPYGKQDASTVALETLSSRSQFSVSREEICADSFVAAFRGKHFAPAVIDHYCQLFYFNSVGQGWASRRLNSCAAARSLADCDLLIKILAE